MLRAYYWPMWFCPLNRFAAILRCGLTSSIWNLRCLWSMANLLMKKNNRKSFHESEILLFMQHSNDYYIYEKHVISIHYTLFISLHHFLNWIACLDYLVVFFSFSLRQWSEYKLTHIKKSCLILTFRICLFCCLLFFSSWFVRLAVEICKLY